MVQKKKLHTVWLSTKFRTELNRQPQQDHFGFLHDYHLSSHVFFPCCALKSTEEFKRLSLQFHCDTKMLQIRFALLFGCSACGKSDSAATSVWITGRKKSFLCRLCYHNFNPDFILLGLCCVYSILWSDPWPFYVLYCHADGTRPPLHPPPPWLLSQDL